MTSTSPKLDSELAYERIVEQLLSQRIVEDVPLSERNLSKKLELGRTPIREAVRDLVREGVLQSHPLRGTFLPALSIADLQDMYEVRLAIEGLAVSLVVERGAVQELEPFALEFDRALQADAGWDVAQVHRRGVEMHEEIFRLSGNRRLVEMYRPLRLRFRIPLAMVHPGRPERVRASLAEHFALVSAILRRDGKAAATSIRDHLREGLEYRTGLLLNRSGGPRTTLLKLPDD
ncbi:GntR family transcriptional regulator [soil metagenome]